ncbi:hypothetical protein D104_07695 [Marinomonas profundimaris]|uniref:Uncharacterized protein n=1 Tax=Marinomonas profundimaris TaxID=1208321 RepID=W1RVL9_9GAMM|nr:hypothetical protein D104_07695 [Marinomonas profundimaris]
MHNKDRLPFSITRIFSISSTFSSPIYGNCDEKEKETLSELLKSSLVTPLPWLLCLARHIGRQSVFE